MGYLCIFSAIFMYVSTYFYIFTTKVCCFTTDCHKSVLFYYRLPQKCGILLQFTDIYYISVVFYYSLTQKCGLEMCQKNWHKQTMCPKCQIPGANLAHNILVPKMANI